MCQGRCRWTSGRILSLEGLSSITKGCSERRCSRNNWMWHLVSLPGSQGGDQSMAWLDDHRGLFKPKKIYDSAWKKQEIPTPGKCGSQRLHRHPDEPKMDFKTAVQDHRYGYKTETYLNNWSYIYIDRMRNIFYQKWHCLLLWNNGHLVI